MTPAGQPSAASLISASYLEKSTPVFTAIFSGTENTASHTDSQAPQETHSPLDSSSQTLEIAIFIPHSICGPFRRSRVSVLEYNKKTRRKGRRRKMFS